MHLDELGKVIVWSKGPVLGLTLAETEGLKNGSGLLKKCEWIFGLAVG
jgi:hypothetical protein